MKKQITFIAVILLLAGLFISPAECIASAKNAIALCLNIVAPSLFPFFVFSELCLSIGLIDIIGRGCERIMRPIFNIPGAGGFAFIFGILSGYPTGSIAALELYRTDQCTKTEAERIIAFCNNAGPLFIVGCVGIGIFHSTILGGFLYATHIVSAIVVGIIFRFWRRNLDITLFAPKSAKSPPLTLGEAISKSVRKSVMLIAFVCGFIVFFSVILAILENYGIIHIIALLLTKLGLPYDTSLGIARGLFEITSGIEHLTSLPAISGILALGGVSVWLQVMGVLAKSNLSVRPLLIGKSLQCLFAALFTYIFMPLLPAVPVFAIEKHPMAITAMSAFIYSSILVLTAVPLFLGLCYVRLKLWPPRR